MSFVELYFPLIPFIHSQPIFVVMKRFRPFSVKGSKSEPMGRIHKTARVMPIEEKERPFILQKSSNMYLRVTKKDREPQKKKNGKTKSGKTDKSDANDNNDNNDTDNVSDEWTQIAAERTKNEPKKKLFLSNTHSEARDRLDESFWHYLWLYRLRLAAPTDYCDSPLFPLTFPSILNDHSLPIDHTPWLNYLLSRAFKEAIANEKVRGKITKFIQSKLDKIRKKSFMGPIVIQEIIFGDKFPILSNFRCHSQVPIISFSFFMTIIIYLFVIFPPLFMPGITSIIPFICA